LHHLNFVDFSIWAKVQAQACKQQQPSLEKLKRLVSRYWSALDPNFKHTCHQLYPQIERMMAAEGGYINVK
jgi:hypothetical protein